MQCESEDRKQLKAPPYQQATETPGCGGPLLSLNMTGRRILGLTTPSGVLRLNISHVSSI